MKGKKNKTIRNYKIIFKKKNKKIVIKVMISSIFWAK